jgi:hypothetical protein
MSKQIIDKYGYAIADYASADVVTDGGFMEGRSFALSTKGGEYYFCHGYSVKEIEDVERHNCSIAMDIGNMRCQCNKH